MRSLKITNGALGLFELKPYNKSVRLTNLNFLVNNFHSDSTRKSTDSSFLFSDNIALETGNQNIEFPDNRHRLKFASLEISTKTRNINITDASLTGWSADTSLSAFRIDFHSLRLINTDFNTLYTTDRIKVDSIFCQDPSVDLFIDAIVKKEKTPSDSTAEELLKQLVGDMDIKYVGLLNSKIAVTARYEAGLTHFKAQNANLEFFGLKIKSNEYQSSLVDRVNISIRNYRASSADSLYDVFLDSITLTEKNLYLKNFRLMPSERNKRHTRRTIIVPTLELRNISFYNFLFFKQLTATDLILRDPSITDFYGMRQVRQNSTQQSFGQILMGISKRVQVNNLFIVNGNLLSQSVYPDDKKIEVMGMYMSVNTKLLSNDTSFSTLQNAISNVAFNHAVMTFPGSRFELTNGIYIGSKNLLTSASIAGATSDNNFILSAENLKVHGYELTKSLDRISIDSISWSSAKIQFHRKGTEKKSGVLNPLDLSIHWLGLENTGADIDLEGGLKLKTDLQDLFLENFHLSKERKVTLSDLIINGKFLRLNKPGLNVQSGEFNVQENKLSYISELEFDTDNKSQTLKGRIPRMDIQFQLSQLLGKGNILASRIDMQNPELTLHLNPGEIAEKGDEGNLLKRIIDISNLNIIQAKLNFVSEKSGQKTGFRTPDATIKLYEFYSGPGKKSFALKKFDVLVNGFDINSKDSLRLFSQKGRLVISGNQLWKGTRDDPRTFTVHLTNAEVVDANTEILRRNSPKPIILENISLGVKDLQIDTLENHHIGQRLKMNPHLFIRNINIIHHDEKNDMALFGLQYTNDGHILSLDSFSYRPAIDKETFNMGLEREKDYIQSRTGPVRISNIDIEKLIADSTFSAGKIELEHPWLSIYKDKHNPFDSSKYKPLPVSLFQKIRIGLELDSIKINNGLIEYTEWNDKTHKIAVLDFKNTHAILTNIRNRNIKAQDSLKLLAYTSFVDSAKLRLQFSESYADSLNAFLMSVRVSPFHLTVLNRFLPAVASAEILSGNLDTLRLRAIGREYLALGYMQFYYHDLKIRFLDKGNPIRKTFKTRAVTFLANNVVLRNKNEDQIGKLYAERIPYRGIFNYWIKIMLSGVLTSTRVKTNDGQVIKYKKQLKKLELPEIPDVDF